MITNKVTVGILAHVDAGKTTLSESILYLSGNIRKMGRVDHKDAFLDTFELEKSRGITIFSKQAVFPLGDLRITLLDTPGHVDFSAEMERTLQVLDYAILVINGADGVQGHTLTLWKLLKRYEIPTFLFVNKMDQVGADRDKLMKEIQGRLSERCIDFAAEQACHGFYDNLAMCDEHLMERYLEAGKLETGDIRRAVAGRSVFPVYFGAALKLQGVEAFLEGMRAYMQLPDYPDVFGARIFKITRDEQGSRLTHMKITGGSLRVKELLTNRKGMDEQADSTAAQEVWEEKPDQIRIYSGRQFQLVNEAAAGTICALTGLTRTRSGDGLGFEQQGDKPILTPVLNYRIQLPTGCDVHGMLQKLRQLEEEEPHLNILWNEQLGEIHAQVMGEIELEILKSMILERFGVEVSFDAGSLVYRETILEPVEGVGHFEPLRHYAEVHLLMEPGAAGSGLRFATACSEDLLERSWQRLVLTHLEEKRHPGVLTGSQITDMKITLVAGRAHLKHTEGGDFRQATYRAVRQGLMKAKSVLLEPVYEFRLEVPKDLLGRAMSDIQRMQGRFEDPVMEAESAVLIGSAPVALMKEYPLEVAAYSRGCGRLFLSLKGYEACHNSAEVLEAMAYDPEADYENPSASVFCSHGAGFIVPWDQVEQHMHVDSGLRFGQRRSAQGEKALEMPPTAAAASVAYSDKELEDIFFKTYGAAKRDSYTPAKRVFDTHKGGPAKKTEASAGGRTSQTADASGDKRLQKKAEIRDKYLLVDGYNIIFAWEDLKEMAKVSLDSARMRLMDMLCGYQSLKHETVILVFDAYKVEGGRGEVSDYHNIHVVYTREAETADQYIEKLVHNISPQYDVTVATSDMLEQMIILGQGATRMSAEGLRAEMDVLYRDLREKYLEKNEGMRHRPFDKLDEL